MRWDMHFHVVGRGAEIHQVDQNVYFNPDDNNLFFTRILYGMVEKDLEKLGADLDQSGSIDTDEYFKLVYRFLKTSEELKGVVLLAMDDEKPFRQRRANQEGSRVFGLYP